MHVALTQACKMSLTSLLATGEFLWVNKISVSRAVSIWPLSPALIPLRLTAQHEYGSKLGLLGE